jgi:transposase
VFWLFLRWLWPQRPETLVLIQSATVDRWHREGVRRSQTFISPVMFADADDKAVVIGTPACREMHLGPSSPSRL